MCLRDQKYVEEFSAKSYNAIKTELIQEKISLGEFAEAIQKLFKNNIGITGDESAIAGEATPRETDLDAMQSGMSRISLDASKMSIIGKVFFLLLFEIARQLSLRDDKTPDGKQYDCLPVGSAIARKISRILAPSAENQEIERLKEGITSLFNCFKKFWLKRKKAIKKLINDDPAVTRGSCREVLKEMFCGSSIADVEFILALRADADEDLSRLENFVYEERIYCKERFEDLQKLVSDNIGKQKWEKRNETSRTFKSCNGKIVIECEHDSSNNSWCLTSQGSIEEQLKKKLSKSLEFERSLYWVGLHDESVEDLKRFVEEFINLEGTWSEEMVFTSTGQKICFKYDDDKKRWAISFTPRQSGIEEKLVALIRYREVSALFKLRNLKIHDVQVDGACFFSAVSHQLRETEDWHKDICRDGINYIIEHPREFEGFFEEESMKEYIERMSKNEEWCDEIIMRAVARAQNVRICVIRPNGEDIILSQSARGEITVGYINGNHYLYLSRPAKSEQLRKYVKGKIAKPVIGGDRF